MATPDRSASDDARMEEIEEYMKKHGLDVGSEEDAPLEPRAVRTESDERTSDDDVPLEVMLAVAEAQYEAGSLRRSVSEPDNDEHGDRHFVQEADTEITYNFGKDALLQAVLEQDTDRIQHLLGYCDYPVTPRAYRAALTAGKQEILDLLNEYSETPLEAFQTEIPASVHADTISDIHRHAEESTAQKLRSAPPNKFLQPHILTGDIEQVRHLLEFCHWVADDVSHTDVHLAEEAIAAGIAAGEPAARQLHREEIRNLLSEYASAPNLPPHGLALHAALEAVSKAGHGGKHATSLKDSASPDAAASPTISSPHQKPLKIIDTDGDGIMAPATVIAASVLPEDEQDEDYAVQTRDPPFVELLGSLTAAGTISPPAVGPQHLPSRTVGTPESKSSRQHPLFGVQTPNVALTEGAGRTDEAASNA